MATATAATEKEKGDRPYEMPEPGDIVLWTYAPNEPWVPAIVTGRGEYIISIMFFPTESGMFVRRESVRHESDPWLREHALDPNCGIWKQTLDNLLLHELARELMPEKYEKFRNQYSIQRKLWKQFRW